MTSRTPVTRWSTTSQAFHWIGAMLIFVLIGHGWWMTEFAPRSERLANYSLHGSVGYFVLVLTLVRLLWRWTHAAPPLPADAPAWERIAATLSHWGLYIFILAASLTGWAMAGAGRRPLSSTLLGLPVPMITSPDPALHDKLEDVHAFLAWTLATIIAIHVAGAFYHLWIRKDDIMRRMLP